MKKNKEVENLKDVINETFNSINPKELFILQLFKVIYGFISRILNMNEEKFYQQVILLFLLFILIFLTLFFT